MFGRRNNKAQEFTVSNRTIVRIIFFVAASILALQILRNMVHPLTLIFVSFFLAMALNPVVHKLSTMLKSKSRVRATAIAYSVVVTILIGFISLVLPPLVSQTSDFISDIPATLRDLETQDGFVGDLVRRYELEEQVTDFANSISENIGSYSDDAINLANRVVSNLISIITVLVLTFMMLIEGPRWLRAFWRQYPKERRKHAQEISGKMYRVVTAYVNGQVLVAGIGSVFAIVALFIASNVFGVSSEINPIALGGIVFLCSLIPTVGVFLAALLVFLFSLFASFPLAITMLIYFIVYQQIENVSIQPIIQSKGTELSPMIIFVSAILGIGFGGVLGAFIAIPVAGCAKVLIDDYLARRDELEEA